MREITTNNLGTVLALPERFVYLRGGEGVGKTTLLFEIGITLLNGGRNGIYVTYDEPLLTKGKKLYVTGFNNRERILTQTTANKFDKVVKGNIDFILWDDVRLFPNPTILEKIFVLNVPKVYMASVPPDNSHWFYKYMRHESETPLQTQFYENVVDVWLK